MPVLTAAGYNNPVAPSIDPLAAPPDTYQNLRADVGSFGGATAQALSGLGTSLERAATNFAAIESEHAKVTALEARTNAERASNNILYGNPEDSTSVGFFGLEGRTKLAARPEVIKQLNAVYDEAGRGLTPEAKRLFDAASRSHRVGVEASVAHDAVKALAQYREQTDKGDIVLAGQNTDRLALSDDLGAWKATLASLNLDQQDRVPLRGATRSSQAPMTPWHRSSVLPISRRAAKTRWLGKSRRMLIVRRLAATCLRRYGQVKQRRYKTRCGIATNGKRPT
jgi:hypothetical protein